ncbi:MAG: energy-coupling factor transporter transmembrane protein EcfT [Oscillospiraceae bacterium]|jgi:energy-coupling factor transport system permease protein|nr:energy-coupling factor transporter transmembrane protein EcfT [Oscillospiraceae bacterium]
MRQDSFAGYHPAVQLLYFALVLGCAVAMGHPVCLALSFVCALACALRLRAGGRRQLLWLLPGCALAALVNPAFSHRGATILAYFPGGNPLTLESILFGISSSAALVTVLLWFRYLNAVLDSEKILWLFGRAAPGLSLLLSLSLRFVPRFAAQARAIEEAQRCVGEEARGLLRRARHGMRVLSILVTWALENAIDTADSMKARGYGLPGRSAFSIYRFDRRDGLALFFLVFCGGAAIGGAAFGRLKFHYYPTAGGAAPDLAQICLFAAYGALCGLPLILNAKEALQWKRLRN